jgi:UDP-glucose 4-epimerase
MPQYIAELIRACIDGRPYRLERGADHRFHFVRVEDVAAATLGALRSTTLRRRTYNVAGGPQTTFREAAALVAEAVPGAVIQIGGGVLELDQQGPFDMSSATRDFGFRPTWPVERGIPDYVAWLREHDF